MGLTSGLYTEAAKRKMHAPESKSVTLLTAVMAYRPTAAVMCVLEEL